MSSLMSLIGTAGKYLASRMKPRNNRQMEPLRMTISGHLGKVPAPVVRQEIVRRGRDHDPEPLRPHPDVDADRDDEQQRQVAAHPLEDEEQRQQDVADDDQRIEAPERSREPPLGELPLEHVAGVPGHERLDDVGIADDRAS